MAAVVGTQPHQVPEDRDRLDRLPLGFQHMGQLVRRLGSQGTGDGVVADRFLAARQPLQELSQVVVEPDVVREPSPAGTKHLLGRLRLPRFGQSRAQQVQIDGGRGLGLRRRGQVSQRLGP